MSTTSFVLRRLADDWKLLLAIFAGITIAATLLAGAPTYVRTLERQGIHTAIDRAANSFLNIYAAAPFIPLTTESLETTDRDLGDAIQRNISDIYKTRERYLKTPVYLVGTNRFPLSRYDSQRGEPVRASRGFFQHITSLEHHVTFLEGRMASDQVAVDANGNPKLEAIIGDQTSQVFDIRLGDSVEFTPSLTDPVRLTVEIVGIVDPTDPTEEYWQQNPNLFIEPAPIEDMPDVGIEIDPDEPPFAAFLTLPALIDGVGESYPGTLVSSSWFVFIDKERLKEWEKEATRHNISGLEADISRSMQGSAVFTGIERLLDRFERRSFFTSVPLLLLLVVTAITVLYYIMMMVSYLVTSREPDVALLRSRGVGSWHLARIYALEGLALTVIAVAIAPFLAMGAIAIAGKLGYFQEITQGVFLPVSIQWRPFAVAVGTGVLCLAIYVVPGVVGARTGLIVHKLRSSRPPSAPFFQRYFIDVGLMVIGGLVFWELFARGQIISGGLFGDRGINEALLFAPVLLLTVVSLLFMRFFPMIVRYLSGDSPTLMHLFAAVVTGSLALILVVKELRADSGLDWLWRLALIALIGGLYFGASRARQRVYIAAALALQAAAIAYLLYTDLPAPDAVNYVPTLLLALLVPLQLLFLALRRLSRVYPVWASMAIWRMARNPLQYSWLVLLIVMVTGLGVLATTVGGTLDRSYKERVLYEVAADLRVTGIPTQFARGSDAVKNRYLTLPGVKSISLAMRGEGSVGATYSGNSFRVLAVESEEFAYVTWYRDDFSQRPLPQVMSLLRTGANLEPIQLPDGADRITVWVHSIDDYPNIFLWMVLQDSRGITDTITFGPVPGPEWILMESQVPRSLVAPVNLVSVQIYEPAFGPGGTAGSILLDDIQASVNRGAETVMLDDFEDRIKWTPLSTSMISRDIIGFTRDNVRNGDRSGQFLFGKDTDRGIRGFYRSPSGGPVPVVASTSFTTRTGTRPGDSIIANVFGRLIPVRIMDTVDYFPTLDPARNGFIIADLDGLLRHINILSPIGNIRPNELLVSHSSVAAADVYDIALDLAPAPDMVHQRAKLLETVRLDPLITAGWRVLMVVALAITIFSAAMGYITYLLSFAGSSRSEMGFLQALGLRRRQMTNLLTAEHLVIVVIGLAIGTAAGFSMTSIMVSALAVTESGNPVVPPFILTTEWNYMVPVYIALGVIFVGALLWLSRSVARTRLSEMARVEAE